MISALKKLNEIIDKRSKTQFSLLLGLLIIKASMDGLGLGLIAPFIASISNPSIVFESSLFKKIY